MARYAPDAILALVNLSGPVTSIDDDPDSPDANWLTTSNNNADTECQVSFPTPGGNLQAGADLQEFRVQVDKWDGTGTPNARVELWENGALVRAGSDTPISGPTVLSFTWNASEITNPADVECHVYGTKTGGAPSSRATVIVGAVEWNATETAPTEDLSADDITAGTPVLESPDIGQIHSLTAAGLNASGPVLDQAALGQIHVLTGTDLVAGTPVLGSPTLAEASSQDDLTADDITAGAPILGAPGIGQVHALGAGDMVSGAPVVDSPGIGQVHTLSGEDLVAGIPDIASPAIGQVHVLTTSAITAGPPVLGTPTLGESAGTDNLAAEDITAGSPVLESPDLAQIHALSGADLIAGSPVIETPDIGQVHVLIGLDITAQWDIGAPSLGGMSIPGQVSISEEMVGAVTISDDLIISAMVLDEKL
jgi:hypothetical protein